MKHLKNFAIFLFGFVVAVIMTFVVPELWDLGFYAFVIPLEWVFVRFGVGDVWAIILVFPVILALNGMVGGVISLLLFLWRKPHNNDTPT
jgi:hypothetical protein